jgi:hypothetical protein
MLTTPTIQRLFGVAFAHKRGAGQPRDSQTSAEQTVHLAPPTHRRDTQGVAAGIQSVQQATTQTRLGVVQVCAVLAPHQTASMPALQQRGELLTDRAYQ